MPIGILPSEWPLNVLQDPEALARRDDFRPLRPGVDILPLYEDESGASAALLRYQPGARVPLHEHQGYEHVLVLSGEQRDERGRYPQGSFMVNAPGTRHRVISEDGCLVLVVWERPVKFIQDQG